jgi:hypothetical protein
MRANLKTGKRRRRGFVIGELLIALLLLTVAVSSLAALMYSVSKRQSPVDKSECGGKAALLPKCAPAQSADGGMSKLLRSGCATRIGVAARDCKDTLVAEDSTGETILRPRTDSTAMAQLANARRKAEVVERPDRGFLR